MKRGDVYLVQKPGGSDPRRRRAFVVVSRQALIDSKYATMVCAPVYSTISGLSSQVVIGLPEGLRHESTIHCDGLVCLSKSLLANRLGSLGAAKTAEVDQALRVALELEP